VPATDVLAGLAIDAIPRSMSAESSRAIRLTTLRQMAKVIGRAIESIEPETRHAAVRGFPTNPGAITTNRDPPDASETTRQSGP